MKYRLVDTYPCVQDDINREGTVPDSVRRKSKIFVSTVTLFVSLFLISVGEVRAATKRDSENNSEPDNQSQRQKNEITNQVLVELTPLQLAVNTSEPPERPVASETENLAVATENAETPLLGEVVAVGNRLSGVKQRESSSPVAVITSTSLKATGQVNLIDALSKIDTSFYVPARSGDLGNLTRQIQIRQLGPNQTLVLVNGKRRHSTAVVNASGTYAGATAVDLAQIPVSAIERIEILKDGAAAQYGSDAIAGVVNIILKSADEGGSVSAGFGRYEPSLNPQKSANGETYNVAVNSGFKIPKLEQAFLNLSAEWTDQNHTNDSGIHPNITGSATNPTPGWTNIIAGQPAYDLYSLGFNSGVKISNDIDLYTFGTAGHRFSSANQNYRQQNYLPAVYPNGFAPVESLDETDFGVTAGAKGIFLGNGRWDLSSTYGSDDASVIVSNSVNRFLFNDTGASPTRFNNGTFTNSQWTNNLDLSKPVYLNFLPAPLNVAGGVEYRRETYQLTPGDAASTYKGGSVAFPGYQIADSRNVFRDVVAQYLEFGTKWTPEWQSTLAGRYEHYSDAGDAATGKFSTRFDYNPRFAIRATASTGFRAPTLGESNFSATNVSPTSTTVQLAVNSPAAKLLGAPALRPEDSTNVSVGFVFEPINKVLSSIDFYEIDITNRIVNSGSISSASSPTAAAALAENNIFPQTANVNLTYFTNGVSTKTRGIDIVTDWNTSFDSYGLIKWKYSGSFANTEVTDIKQSSAALGGGSVVTPSIVSALENGVPKFKQSLSASYLLSDWTINARVTHYGASSQLYANQITGLRPYQNVKISDTALFDLSIAYDITKSLNFLVGANNILGTRPDQIPVTTALRGSTLATVYPTFSPFPVDGAYYYARATFKF